MHSSRMRTAGSRIRLLGGLPHCMLGYTPHSRCGPGPPRCGPGVPPPDPSTPLSVDLENPLLARPLNLPPWVWAWRTPHGQTPQHPPRCGPGDPPVNRILDTHFWKYYVTPTSLLEVLTAVWLCNFLIGLFVSLFFQLHDGPWLWGVWIQCYYLFISLYF